MFDPTYFSALIDDRRRLAKLVSLIESDAPDDQDDAADVVRAVDHHLETQSRSGKIIAVTGMPGAGKSTFINSFGVFLADQGLKIAVLAIDPSSALTTGAIMGDKTRMQDLARHPNAFIRPSPSGAGYLGGLSATSEDVTLLLKAVGFDYIFLETIGVGQNESDGCLIADQVIMIVPPATGDDIQAIKRGNIELVDLILINKCDGETKALAHATASDYRSSIEADKKIILVSAYEKTGFDDVVLTMNNRPNRNRDIRRITEQRIEKTVFNELKKMPVIEDMFEQALNNPGSSRGKTSFFISELKKLLTKAL